jgi:hypothetical protein
MARSSSGLKSCYLSNVFFFSHFLCVKRWGVIRLAMYLNGYSIFIILNLSWTHTQKNNSEIKKWRWIFPPTKIGKTKNCLTSFPFVNQSNQRMIMFLQMTSPLPGVVAGVFRAIMWWDCWWRLWLWLFWRSRLLVRKGFHVNRLPAVVERAWLLVPLSTVLSRSLFECRLKLKKSAARLSRPVMVRSRLRPPFEFWKDTKMFRVKFNFKWWVIQISR